MSALGSFGGGRVRRVRRIAIVSVLVVAGLMWISAAQAVHDTGVFELDGNVVHNAATIPPYDWTNLFGPTGNQLVTPDPVNGPLLASVFVDDTDAIDTTYFAGGTKIDDRIHNMSCGGPAANDKTSLDFVYGANIHVPVGAPDDAGHDVLYLGLEKQAAGNGGDNAFGFWLFKDKTVGCSGSGSFTGAHTDGDLFIDGLFTNGGGASNIQVFRWNGNDITGSLGSTPVATGDVCGVVATNDQQCAIANNGTIASGPWRSSPTMAKNTFVEAGIDLTTLLGTQGGCFSTFLVDSQSSQSTSSQPKDYAGGTLNTCVTPPISTTATPGGSTVPLGDANQFDVATISAAGGHPAPTGKMTFFLCNPSQVTSGGCVSGGTQVGNPVSINAGSASSDKASGSLLATIGKYCWRSEYNPDADGSKFYNAGSHTNATDECFTVVKNSPTIMTTPNPTSVTLGAPSVTLKDSAVLSGGHSPTGTITFTLVYNSATVDTETVSVSGNNTYTTPSGYTLPTSGTVTGTYQWNATYSGDGNNNPVSENNDASERVTVNPGSSATATVVKDHNGGTVDVANPAALGSKVHDTATVTASPFTATGTVTYHLYSGLVCNGNSEIGSAEQVTLSGGNVPDSSETAALAAGSYSYQAVYSGDGNYTGSTGACEPFKIAQAGSATATVVKDHNGGTVDVANPAALGSKVHDTATVTASPFTATGTVTYHLYSGLVCNGNSEIGSAEQVTLSGGNVPDSSETAALAAGSYSYQAVYSGDGNYTGSTGACEPFKIAQAGSATATVVKDHNGGTVDVANPAALGSKVHDTATVTASPFTATGTVTYHLYSGLVCNGNSEIGSAEQVTLSGGNVPDSSETAALAAGSYSYQAVYSGDGNYTGSTGACEPFKIAQAGSATATVVKDHNGGTVDVANPAALGSKVHDTATVTASPFTATGTVTYHLYSGLVCNGNSEIGSAEQVTLSGGNVPDSSETAALAAGSYSYQAVYSGDGNYTGSTGACEPFKIAQAGSATATVVKDHNGGTVDVANPAALGSKVHDTATVTASPFTATGTVTYHLYSGLVCNGNSEIGSAEQVTLSGGNVPDSSETAALAAGSYSYQAVYSGDGNYTGSTGACEPFKIAQASSSADTVVFDAGTNAPWSGTEQTGAKAYDTASVSSGNDSFTPSGTVSYQFFANGSCSGEGTDAGTVTLSAGAVPNSGTQGPLGAGNYSFQATYSGDDNFIGSTGPCEPFSLGLLDTSTATVVKDHDGNVVDAANPAALGSQVHDTATVSGQVGEIVPTGTVTYHLYSGLDCSVDSEIGSGEQVTLSGGNVPDSSETDPLQAGSYSYEAVYSGDTDYATSTGPCEPFKVAQASSSTDTVVNDHDGNVVDAANPAALGSQVHDTATVTSGNDSFTPSGTVTYHLYSGLDCSVDSEIGSGEQVTLSGGNVPDSSETDPLQAGSYSYEAVYSGDDNFAGSTGPCEPFKVAQASSSTDTVVKDHDGNVVDAANPAALGSQVHDTATVTSGNDSFTPSGTVTYHLYSGLDCSVDSEIGSGEQVTLSGGNVPDSSETDPLQAGSYSYQAVYSSDNNYATSTGPCEPFKVAQASSSTDTVVKDHDGNVVDAANPAALGSQVHDTATVTSGNDSFTPSGTVTYHLYSGLDCSVDSEIGSAEQVTLSGGNVPDSSETDPLAAGSYSYRAVYSGDGNFVASTGPCEPFKVAQGSLTPSTTIKNAADGSTVDGALPLGSKVFDTTQLSGAVEGFDPTGTVSYRFFQNRDCSGEGSSAGSDIALDGQSDTQGPLGAGDYSFQATYSGDSNYKGATSPCEPLTIGKVTPSASTTLKNAATDATVENGSTLANGSSVYDTADISNAGGFPLTGTVSFRFFHNGDCSGTPASVQTGVAVGGHSAATGALDEGSYGFQAMYVAGDDSNHSDSAWSACEPFNVQGLVDLAVTKTGSPNPVSEGANITWTMVVTNNGPDTDTGVMVSDPLPAGTTFVSVFVPPPATCTGGAIISCSLGTMTAGQSITITLVTTANVAETITNTVHVVRRQARDEPGKQHCVGVGRRPGHHAAEALHRGQRR